MRFKFYIYVFAAMLVVLSAGELRAAITTVVVTSADSGTPFAGSNYYKTGNPYVFVVTVTTGEVAFSGIDDVTLTIPGSPNITLSVDPNAPGTVTVTGDNNASAACVIAGAPGNFTATFTYTPTAGVVGEMAYTLGNNIFATATSDDPNTVNSANVPRNYGIVDIGLNSVTVTTVDPGDTYAGSNYYNSGNMYTFVVTTTADGHNLDCVDYVRLTIPGDTPIVMTADPFTGTVVSVTGDALASVAVTVGGTVDNFTVQFDYTPTAAVDETAYAINNPIQARALSVFDGAAFVDSATVPTSYGIVHIGLNSVTVTTVDPGDAYAGSNYYNSGNMYTFVVTTTADGHNLDCVDYVRLTIPGDTPIVMTADPFTGTVVSVTGDALASVAVTVGGTVDNFTVQFDYTPTAAVDETAYAINNPVQARALSVFDGAAFVDSATVPTSYGIVHIGLNSVTVTTVDPGDTYAGSNYYNSGNMYTFVVTTTADGHNLDCVDYVRLTIPGDTPIVMTADPFTGTVVSVTGDALASVAVTVGGTVDNFTVQFDYTPTAAVDETAYAINNPVQARALSVFDGAAFVDSATVPTSYGIVHIGLNSVDTTAVGARTALTPGDFYLSGNTYTFTVAVTADGHNFSCVSDVSVTIQSTAGIILTIVPNNIGGTPAVAITGGDTNGLGAVATSLIGGVNNNNFNVTFTYTPSWSASESPLGLKNITASAKSVFDALPLNDSTPTNINYGVCSTGKVVSMSNGGEAGDGYVNPWNGIFNITGNIVYNVAGAVAPADNILTAFITADVELLYDHDTNMVVGYESTDNVSGLFDAAQDPAFTINVPINWFDGNPQPNNGIGRYDWKIRTTIGGFVRTLSPTPALLSLICDKYQIQDIQFQNGGGYNGNALTSGYNRNIYTPGTQMRVQLGLQYQGIVSPVALDVISRYNYGSGVRSTNLTVAAGSGWSGWFEITNPLAADVAAGTTLTHLYNNAIDSILDPSGIYSGGTGQNVLARISVQDPSPPTILWDNLDPPPLVTTPVVDIVNITVDTIPISWTPIAASLALAGPDADFYTYRIYYKPTALTAWTVIDLNTPSYAFLGNIAASSFNLINLQALTAYDIYITAVDVFGNETAFGGNASATTLPSTSYVTISDGITSYADATFTADPLPSARPLLDAAIRVEVNIVGATQPDELYVVLMDNAEPIPYNPPLGTYYRIALIKTSPNTWAGHISSENLLITPTRNCKFILEAVQDGVSVYYDHDSEIDSDPNTFPWTFTIVNPLVVIPWPTRVLNNVITDNNPVAYPAYYLTDDANVTITAYDIKGRIVAILLDNAPRKSGINIRENGWRGTNKSGRKLGVGLYYLHIKAKRHSDGKVIIDKFNKVVMAR